MSTNFSALDVSASGLMAERLRMEVTANNIANANTTMTDAGEPYRRQSVIFSSVVGDAMGSNSAAGVKVLGVESDMSDFPTVFSPGYPHADANGMLRTSNVHIPNEMIDLITASRSYEANLKSITLFKQMVEQTLVLLRGLGQ